MNLSRESFRSELRLSPLLAIGALIAVSLALFIVTESTVPEDRIRLYLFCILALTAAAALGVLAYRVPQMARTAALITLLTAVYLGAPALEIEELLSLAGISTLLAAALLGLPAAGVTAVIEGAALIFLSQAPLAARGGIPLIGSATLVIRLTALMLALIIVVAIYRRIYTLGEWLWGRSEFATEALEEMRDRKADLEQALGDLVHANRQLALASERMGVLRTIAEDAQKAKATFVAKVSHEFRTPLNMIIGLVSLMVDSPQIYAVALSPDMRKDLQIVYRNCQHLAQMVNDILNLTQMETGRLVLHRERFDLGEMIGSSVSAVQPLLDKKQLYLVQEIPSDLPSIYCDRTRIQQVVLNLISNAARFTEEGGVTVSVEQKGQQVVVRVRDTGSGIAPDDVGRIFEPFCQGSDALWRDRTGSGLGLTISKQFVELHGGRIWVESEPGVGATFSFSLPVSGPVEPVALPGRWIREDWEWHQRTSRAAFSDQYYRWRIVLSDPTGVLHARFSAVGGEIEFVDTRDIEETIRALQETPAHAVLLNAERPEELPALVTSLSKEIPTTPVIGCAVAPMTARVAASGATGYLIKPIARTDLERVIEAQSGSVRTVLLIDDDLDVLSLYTRMLLTYDPALTVRAVSSGKAALAALGEEVPDLVLLDVFMPDMNGWQVLGHLRQEPQTKDLPVYFLSAQDPADQPPGSKLVLAAMGEELSLNWLLRCSVALSELLLTPESELDRETPRVFEVPPA
jgi:signal transduction histidine kinase/CheY-like chemotaxis protein